MPLALATVGPGVGSSRIAVPGDPFMLHLYATLAPGQDSKLADDIALRPLTKPSCPI
jgi:hypothetical protein